ncbi:MAG: adenylate/guanylate cyclase domain-containing protein [Chthoniobacterales bacterium]
MLFADLRRFTSWCEAREASLLVRELNRLLALQADVVISAGGDVDKFIGDSVMAVFIDDHDTPERIFTCAQQLVRRIRREIQMEGWPLALGVGIHRGRAVVGSIGSSTRRDFTAIGHTVNLASRLCDRARKWEILVSQPFHEMLGVRSQLLFAKTEAMAFKHVSQSVATYSFNLPESAPAEMAEA